MIQTIYHTDENIKKTLQSLLESNSITPEFADDIYNLVYNKNLTKKTLLSLTDHK
jgi:hypothetical protein